MTDGWGREIRHDTLIKTADDLCYLVLENRTVVTKTGMTLLFEGLHVFRGQEYHGNLEEFVKSHRDVEVFLYV